VRNWSYILSGWRRSFERYGGFTLYATLAETMLLMAFGAATEETKGKMHAWLLIIPSGLFFLAFIWECGKVYGESKNLERKRMNEIQNDWLRYGRHGKEPPRK
jgi:hypothetical protein